jgi:hypothetical protein
MLTALQVNVLMESIQIKLFIGFCELSFDFPFAQQSYRAHRSAQFTTPFPGL